MGAKTPEMILAAANPPESKTKPAAPAPSKGSSKPTDDKSKAATDGKAGAADATGNAQKAKADDEKAMLAAAKQASDALNPPADDANQAIDELFGIAKPPAQGKQKTQEEIDDEEASKALEADKGSADADALKKAEDDKAAAAAAAASGKEGGSQDKPGGVKQLREAYEKTKAEKLELEKKIEELSTKKADLPPEFVQKLDAIQKDRDELEKRLEFIAYEKSQEFSTKYDAPVKNALKEISTTMSELTVTKEDGTERPATMDDFVALVRMPLKQAAKVALDWFGPAGTDLITKRSNYINLVRAREGAVEAFKNDHETIIKNRQQQEQVDQQRVKTLWNNIHTEKLAKFEQIIGSENADGKALLEEGLNIFDAAGDQNIPLTFEQRLHVKAGMRLKAAAFDPVVRLLHAERERSASLEEEIKKMKEGQPGLGAENGAGSGAQKELTAFEEIDAMANPKG